MSLRKTLGRLFLFGVLQFGVLAGVKISNDDIEKIMQLMHRVKVVQVLKKEQDGE